MQSYSSKFPSIQGQKLEVNRNKPTKYVFLANYWEVINASISFIQHLQYEMSHSEVARVTST